MYHLLAVAIFVAWTACTGNGYPYPPVHGYPFIDIDTPDTPDLVYVPGSRPGTGGLIVAHNLCDASVCRLRSCPDEIFQPTGMCICKSEMCDIPAHFLAGPPGHRSSLYPNNVVG